MTLLLNRADVIGLISMKQAIELAESVFIEHARDRISMPQRAVMAIDRRYGLCAFMPAYIPRSEALGFKSVTAFKENTVRYHLPTIFGMVSLLDDKTGEPLAIMDGGYLTGVRTGAASAIATKCLARQNAQILGVLGSGEQALFQIWAVCEVRPIKEVKVYSPNLHAKKEAFLERVQSLVSSDIQMTNTAESAVAHSDVVVLATNAESPVIDADWLSPGTHINAVGSHSPGARELDTKTACCARIICDSVEACLAEAGDLIIPVAEGALNDQDIQTSLGEVICGLKKGRINDEELTVFKSVGLAFQDVSAARYVYEQAVLMARGTHFEFFA